MIIKTFQAEQKAWTEKNFGLGTTDRPLLGLFEEFGELCHAELKSAQGIRGDAAKHETAARDAVGDFMIYFADYATKRRLAIDVGTRCVTFEEMQERLAIVPALEVSTIFQLGEALGQVARYHEQPDDSALLWEALHACLRKVSTFCKVKSWSLDAIVTETWVTVSQRDWTKNKETGGV